MKTAVFYENIVDGAHATGRPVSDALEYLRDEGMEMLYISVDSWKRDRKELCPLLDRLNLPVEGMHGFCDFPGDPDSSRYREMIDLATEAGAGNLLFVPGMYSNGNTIRDLENMVAGMRKAVEYGQSRNLPILMEDYDGAFAPYNCIAGLQYFFRNVPGLECAFDTGNFVVFRENEIQAFELFSEKIRTVHLKDRSTVRWHEGDTPFSCADGGSVFACRIGSGYIQIAEILRRLKEQNYEGNVIVELYACDAEHVLEEAVESLHWVRDKR